jgi:hypothetical protein
MTTQPFVELAIAVGMLCVWRSRGPWMLFLSGVFAGRALTAMLDFLPSLNTMVEWVYNWMK